MDKETVVHLFVIVQLLSRVRLLVTSLTAAHWASLSFTISWSLLKLMSFELVMSSNHLILCRPLLVLPSIFPSIRVLSNELVLHIRCPKYWSFSISPSNKYSGLISFRIDWFDLLSVQGTLPITICLVCILHLSFSIIQQIYWAPMVFPVVMYGCESWTVKKAEHRRIDAFELWCWGRLLRVPWTARRSSQSILKISPGISLEGMMLKLKLQYFGHLMWRVDS